jgi:hypothetical protein
MGQHVNVMTPAPSMPATRSSRRPRPCASSAWRARSRPG